MKAKVIIENATIDKMLLDPRYTTLLPCLKQSVSSKVDSCKTCPRRRRAQTTIDYARCKKCIGALAGSTLTSLKQLLETERIAVSYSVGTQRITKNL